MLIRQPSIKDLSEVAAINNHYLGRATMQLSPVSAANFMIYLPGDADIRHSMLVGIEDERLIGFALVKPYSVREGYVLAGETSVYLAPEQTRRGLGRLLMEGILDTAKELDYRHLTAKIWTENTGSIQFHQRLGYRLVGVQHGIGWVNERRIDTTIMECLL